MESHASGEGEYYSSNREKQVGVVLLQQWLNELEINLQESWFWERADSQFPLEASISFVYLFEINIKLMLEFVLVQVHTYIPVWINIRLMLDFGLVHVWFACVPSRYRFDFLLFSTWFLFYQVWMSHNLVLFVAMYIASNPNTKCVRIDFSLTS